MSYRGALIVSLLPALMAWALALAVAGAGAAPASTAILVADASAPAPLLASRHTEGDEPVALVAATALPSPRVTPAPTETPRVQSFARTVSTAERERYAAIIRAAAQEFGQDPELLVLVARCESSLNPRAVGGHGELGILQFKPPTFERNGTRLGYSLADIWDVRAQARVAAEMFSRNQQWQWTCVKKVASR